VSSEPAAGGEPPLSLGATVTIQHLLVRYAKRGKMRFASHLDVARAFERGVRRASLPIAYSAGFTPHPKISYAGGAPTGVASEAEYLSLTLTSRTEADAVRVRLNAALPDGIDVIAVTEDSGGLPASRLTASQWQVALPTLTPDNVVPVVQKFLALSEAPVERLTSKGLRRMDARAAVVSLDVCCLPGERPPVPPDVRADEADRKNRDFISPVPPDEELPGGRPPVPPDVHADGANRKNRDLVSPARPDEELTGGEHPVRPDGRPMERTTGYIGHAEGGQERSLPEGTVLRMVVRHTVPSVRPDDVLNALRDVSDVFPAGQPLITRLAQGSLGESGVVKL
jgi:radical SAM-linked protein